VLSKVRGEAICFASPISKAKKGSVWEQRIEPSVPHSPRIQMVGFENYCATGSEEKKDEK
jgi:hypothetical protein